MSDLVLRAWVALETLKATTLTTDKEERGQGTVEYALILALVAVVAIIVLVTLGQRVSITFNNASTSICNRSPPSGRTGRDAASCRAGGSRSSSLWLPAGPRL